MLLRNLKILSLPSHAQVGLTGGEHLLSERLPEGETLLWGVNGRGRHRAQTATLVYMLQDPLMQQAAFQDLCFLAEAQGPQAWRRKIVFDKDNGELWQQIGIICIDEVNCSCILT